MGELTVLTVLRMRPRVKPPTLPLVAAIRALAGARKEAPLKFFADAPSGTSAVVASALAAISIKIEGRFSMFVLLELTLASKLPGWPLRTWDCDDRSSFESFSTTLSL